MKQLLAAVIFLIAFVPANAQTTSLASIPDSTKKILMVDASCGECKFGMKGKSCDLAVKIKGKAYFVDGVHIDSLGDAHAEDGFCKAIRKAAVQGDIVNNRFKATYFKLIDHPAKKP